MDLSLCKDIKVDGVKGEGVKGEGVKQEGQICGRII